MTIATQPTDKPRPEGFRGAVFAEHEKIDRRLVEAVFSRPDAFVSLCTIVRENESTGFLDPTLTQRKVLEAFDNNRWVMVNKYRQAKISTLSVLHVLLRDCMYLAGVKGLLIAERHDTAEDIFDRIVFAYNNLPEPLKMPLAPGRKVGATQLHFAHGGNIKILTAGGRAPSVGRSPDRLVITEWGEADWQEKAAINIFPSINKRPNARVVVESTPGRAGSHHYTMWESALEGRSRFHPVFLEWWRDDTCASPTHNFKPTPTELEYLARHEGMTNDNLAFRRMAINTEFVGDQRLFGAKYPSDPYDGWLGSMAPVIPKDVLDDLLRTGINPPPISPSGCHELSPPDDRTVYLITADPAGYGASGDPSALIVWDTRTFKDVAFWQGREPPDRFAQRLQRVQERYSGSAGLARLAVESNAQATIAILRDMRAKGLIWTDRNHPGWYATMKRLQKAEARLVQLLRQRDLEIRCKPVLHELLHYDGSDRNKRRDGHHFDLSRCVIIAADLLARRAFVPQDRSSQQQTRTPGMLTVADLDKVDSLERDKFESPFKSPPQW